MRAVVIGSGFGAGTVAPIYADLGIDVDVVTPRDGDAVRRACAGRPDLVSVHSPPFLHREHVLLAIEQGAAVLCDKPFGISAHDARDMCDVARAAGVINLLNFEFRHDPARVQVKALVDDGAIGRIQHVRWSMFTAGSRRMPYGWLFDRSSGGGWIGAYGSHVIDTLRWWIGDIDTVAGVSRTDLATRPDRDGDDHVCTAEDAFAACVTFTGGATATIDSAFAASVSQPQHIEVFGSEGVLVLDGVTDLTLLRHREDTRHFEFPPAPADVHAPAFTAWARRVHDSVRDGDQISPSFDDGLACAVVMDQLRVSGAAEG